MELNGMRRALAFEERFIVAESGGKVLAALRYHTEPERLLLGLLVSDPWAQERPLAVALYTRDGELAREMGAQEVLVRSVCTLMTIPAKRGIAGGIRVAGTWTRGGLSTVAKSCSRSDGGG